MQKASRLGEKICEIDAHTGQVDGFSLVMRQLAEQGLERRIGSAGAHEYTDYKRGIARLVNVNKVDLQGIMLALDRVFAGGVEVELRQTIRGPRDGDRAPRVEIRLYGVAIVHHTQFGPMVVKSESGCVLRRLRGTAFGQGDWRLMAGNLDLEISEWRFQSGDRGFEI